jgi:hypothetical protein
VDEPSRHGPLGRVTTPQIMFGASTWVVHFPLSKRRPRNFDLIAAMVRVEDPPFEDPPADEPPLDHLPTKQQPPVKEPGRPRRQNQPKSPTEHITENAPLW